MEFSHSLKTMGDISKLNLDLYVEHRHNAGKINLYDLCDSALQYFPYNRINFNKTIENTLKDVSPQTFNPLIVNTLSNYHRRSSWYELCDSSVLPSFVTSNTRWQAIISNSRLKMLENSLSCMVLEQHR